MTINVAPLLLAALTLLCACGSSGSSGRVPPPSKGGIITLSQSENVWYGFASYGGVVPPACEIETFGSCAVDRSCDVPDSREPAPTFEAGTVTVHGFTIPFEASGGYYSGSIPSEFKPGDVVEMGATGSADVPPHSASVVVPPGITVLEPLLDGIVTVDRSRDFEASWMPVDTGGVTFQVTALAGTEHTTITCWAPAATGRMTVPADALSRLPPTSDDVTARVGMSNGNQRTLHPNGWEIYLGVPAIPRGAGADAEVF